MVCLRHLARCDADAARTEELRMRSEAVGRTPYRWKIVRHKAENRKAVVCSPRIS